MAVTSSVTFPIPFCWVKLVGHSIFFSSSILAPTPNFINVASEFYCWSVLAGQFGGSDVIKNDITRLILGISFFRSSIRLLEPPDIPTVLKKKFENLGLQWNMNNHNHNHYKKKIVIKIIIIQCRPHVFPHVVLRRANDSSKLAILSEGKYQLWGFTYGGTSLQETRQEGNSAYKGNYFKSH